MNQFKNSLFQQVDRQTKKCSRAKVGDYEKYFSNISGKA